MGLIVPCTDKHNAWISHRGGGPVLWAVTHELVSGSRKNGGWKPKTNHQENHQAKKKPMNTSLNSASKADIMCKLHEIIDYHLFESTSWPIEGDALSAFFRTLDDMGLQEAVLGESNASRYTALGVDCGAPLATYFIGAHEPIEIPMSLEQEGLIGREEAETFYSSLEDDDDSYVERVEKLVRHAHRRFCGVKSGVMQ